MGRIKTTFIKHIGKDLFEKHENEFTAIFEKNKEVVNQFVFVRSKRLRNIITGYITTLKKQQKA